MNYDVIISYKSLRILWMNNFNSIKFNTIQITLVYM